MNLNRAFILILALAAGSCGTVQAEAPQSPNPAVDAGVKWPARRAQLENEWLKMLGPFPATKPPLDPEILSTETVKLEPSQINPYAPRGASSEITRYKVKFRSEADSCGGTKSDIWIYGWLLVPKSATETVAKDGRKTPAVICLHSTTYGAGKSSPAGLTGRYTSDPNLGFVGRPELAGKDPRYQHNLPNLRNPDALTDYYAGGRAAGLILAQQGFVTLSIDFNGDGERVEPSQRSNDSRQFYKRYPDMLAESAWSVIGKCVWDISRSVDYLQSLPYVNPKGIGCTGWSYGGHVTLFAAALDQRIAAAVPDGGVFGIARTIRRITKGNRRPMPGRARPPPWSRGRRMARSPPPAARRRCGVGVLSKIADRLSIFRSFINTLFPRIAISQCRSISIA